MDTAAPHHFVPPVPSPPDRPLSLRAFLRAVRTNALIMWPEAAYHQDSSVRHFFGRVNVLLNTPDAIHHVLVDNHANYRRSPASIRILRPIMGDGLLLSQGENWKLQRRTVAPALAPRVMPMLARHVAATVQEALDRQTIGDRVDLLAAMQFLALEIAGRSMFSMEMHEHGAAMRRMLTDFSRHYAQPYLLDMLLPPSIPTLRDFARRRFQRRWMALIEDMMRDRLRAAPPETPRDLFDLLRAARDPETGAGFSPAQLRDQVATLILAGHETTAVTLFWALTLLAQAPDEQARLAGEVREAALGPDHAFATIASLVRTKAVVNETLRLFPPAFTLVREAIATDRIGDLTLPPRSVVMIAPWVLHRHHRLWPDPAAFDPSRFMPDAPPPPRFAFLPFGAGPRICVGAQFAMTEAILVLASVIQRFRVELADDRPVLPVAVVTTQPDHAPPFRLTRR
jgi:cytochrome P450